MALQQATTYRADYIWQTPDDDGDRYDVIDGVLYVTGTPWRMHQHVLRNVSTAINTHVQRHGRGEVYFVLGVVLDEMTAVVPDLIYVTSEHTHLFSNRGLEGPPDLAVEVLSPWTRRKGRVIKVERYACAGISHYWIIDPLALTLEAYKLRDGAYVLAANLRDEDEFTPSLFPGLTIPLARLWA